MSDHLLSDCADSSGNLIVLPEILGGVGWCSAISTAEQSIS